MYSLILFQSTELLLEKGYQVHGIIRRSSSFNTGRLHHLYEEQHESMHPLLSGLSIFRHDLSSVKAQASSNSITVT